MKILVCGGREFSDKSLLDKTLNNLDERYLIECVVQGGASGADKLALNWSKKNDITCITCEADWKTYGKAAGPLRNQYMIDRHKPDLVVAFPGGKGTADMVKRAKFKNIKVVEVSRDISLEI